MTPWAEDVVARLEAAFTPARQPDRAPAMAAYMRDQFPFIGLPTPERTSLQRQALAGLRRPTAEADVLDAADGLWALEEREYQYAGCAVVDRHARLLRPTAITRLERLLTTKAWWDTVDSLRRPLGVLLLGHPELQATLRGWNAGADRWLVRSSIIVQLGFKQRTDEAFLFEMCANRATDREFFVRKAIGWALREHSKVDADAVRRFVAAHPELSPLSKREALKWLEHRSRSAVGAPA